ncbi:PREDICTED: uncharacterized protein LOC101293210 [Fragaria vesca subsp. vesca]|uniref:uncharacterized protein LOC101293210 n=1 Tax=Fragaria vesca subsp. vesca TaxID=101020 RepID=UPI0002C3673B|nr:PREDICTED: uncharacterized protein LOC101293210 [Fragaria vesca subsp. vesca]
MEKLSEVTLDANKAESSIRTRLLDLAVSLLPGLNSGEVDNLFTATKLALQDNEILIQTKAYEVLSIVFKKCHTFTSWKIEEWHRLMMEVLPSCHSSAKEHRLECLHLLVVQVLKSDTEQRRPEITSSFLAEIIHALKETNKRTRDRAFDILVQIGHACGDAERGGTREHRHKFFDMVAEGLACRTPHMISATTEGLARLAFEFSDLVSTSTNLLPSTLRCLPSGSQEIIKSNLGFLKVLVAKLPSEVLQLHTKSMVENLLSCQVYCATSLKAKVKLLVEMVVNKCGLQNIRAVIPGERMELLAELQKITEGQEKRILGCNSKKERSHMSKASTFRLSRWNYTEIFSDFDEETVDSKVDNMDVDTVSGRCGKSTSRLKSKSVVRSKSRKHKRSDEDVEFTTFALARKKLLRQRVELQVDHASERFSASARQTAPDSYDRWLAKIAAGEVISGAAQKNLGLKLKRVDIKHGM